MPPKMSSSTSLYEILGIPHGATSQEIKSAYRKLARTCHPDVAAIDRKDNSADEFMRIHAAYTTLSDPERRVVYDRKQLFRRMRPLTTAGLSGYSGRSWETDQCW
ncbi:Chaperone protein dnaJ 11, chloroplastic [Linum perenne]